MQSQAGINIHVGGRSALELQGSTHYLQFTSAETTLFAPGRVKLPHWISSSGRAMMECLSLCPNEFTLTEAYELMEGLSTLCPKQVQELLEECKSVKVKRLFLYFAERSGHSWFRYIDKTRIDLGSRNRSLVSNGVLIAKYKLFLPKELA